MQGPGCFALALIVEDDDELRRAIARITRGWKAETLEAASIAEGHVHLAREPDLVVTDVRLPDGSGLEIAAAAAKQRPLPLIVAMSGVASAKEAFELAQHGVNVYLTKPFRPAEFSERVEASLEEPKTLSSSTTWEVPIESEIKAQLEANLSSFVDEHKLTPREVQLTKLAISGIPRRRYADMLGVTENTCKTMIRRLLHKCGGRNLADIARLMLLRGSSPA